MNQKPIFIIGAHKSGTTLLRNLLDGHPSLYAIPIESHFFQISGFWIDNEYRQQYPINLSNKDIRNRAINYISEKNKNTNKYGGSFAKDLFNIPLFKNKFKIKHLKNNTKFILEQYFKAIYYSINKRELGKERRIVEKSVENAEFAQYYNKFYPQAKFIHIIRNPYSNFVSLRKYKSIDFGYPIIRRMLRTLYNNYYYLYRNQKLIKNYFIIRYEDLVTNPSKWLKKISNFLDIEFQNSLLEPTYRGVRWKGNSLSDKNFTEISPIRLNSWKKEINPIEIIYINHLFKFVLKDFDYSFFNKTGSFWNPAPGESIKRYFANRLYRFYLQEW